MLAVLSGIIVCNWDVKISEVNISRKEFKD
jgi:hypothetical protein